MSVVRRRSDAVDALEHAMQGVQTQDLRPIESRNREPGPIGKSSDIGLRLPDDTPMEHEVTVRVRRATRRVRSRRPQQNP